jgi:hypothetical protein
MFGLLAGEAGVRTVAPSFSWGFHGRPELGACFSGRKESFLSPVKTGSRSTSDPLDPS